MAIEILMPALSPTMETGTLATWNVAVGDAVRSGDVIAEIETDKATMEVEAVDDGVLAVILVEAGSENVAVGTPIGIVLGIVGVRQHGHPQGRLRFCPSPRQPAQRKQKHDCQILHG